MAPVPAPAEPAPADDDLVSLLALVDRMGLSTEVAVKGTERLGGSVCDGDDEHRPMSYLTAELAVPIGLEAGDVTRRRTWPR